MYRSLSGREGAAGVRRRVSPAALRSACAGGATCAASSARRFPQGTIERLIGIACLSPSVGLSEPWRFVIVEDEARRALIRQCFEACNKDALEMQTPDRAALYARLKLAGLDDAPCQLAVFSDRSTAQGAGLGRLTMPETLDYSVVNAVHTLWLAARAEGIGLGWVSILDAGAHRRDSRRAARLGVHRPSLHRLSAQGRRHAGAGAGRVGAPPRPRRRRAVPVAAATSPSSSSSRTHTSRIPRSRYPDRLCVRCPWTRLSPRYPPLGSVRVAPGSRLSPG